MLAIKTQHDIINSVDRQIIEATQSGLPLSRTPYQDIAQRLGMPLEELLRRLHSLQDRGIIRRIGIIPNHYKLGFKANGMSVWNVPDEKTAELGKLIGSLDYVSHCYKRPCFLPHWPYNLFAMVHGQTREEVMQKVDQIAYLLTEHSCGHDVLFSKRILKKTGLRLATHKT